MDPEIKAMSDLAQALDSLEPEVITRVLRWANERYRTKVNGGAPGQPQSPSADASQFSGFHDLFDAANPETAADKALVTAYWFQILQGQEELESYDLNTELKNLGHPSTNITRDLDALMNRTPRYIMQVRKEGTTKQARKKYKLTREGIRAVERLLDGKYSTD